MWGKTPSVNLFPVSRFLSRHSGDKSSCTASIVDMALPRIQNETGAREVTKEQLSGFVLIPWNPHYKCVHFTGFSIVNRPLCPPKHAFSNFQLFAVVLRIIGAFYYHQNFIVKRLPPIVKRLPHDQTIAKTYRLTMVSEKRQSHSYFDRKSEKFCPNPEAIKSEMPCAAMGFTKQKRTPTFYQSKRPMVVEHRRFELLTPTLPVWCATNCANAPFGGSDLIRTDDTPGMNRML